MPKIRTHYDNLHIPRDADEQTIRLAYRRLSKQYHPDLNPGKDTSRIMQLINRAYEVLSDPVQRAEHDRWIREQEAPRPQIQITVQTHAPQPAAPAHAAASPAPPQKDKWQRWLLAGCCMLTLLFFWQLVLYLQDDGQPENDAVPAAASVAERQPESPHAASPAEAPPAAEIPVIGYVRPSAAPNGEPFPRQTGYIGGYPQTRAAGGRWRIYADNIRNTSDVFAELYIAGETQPLRTFFVEERSQMELDGLASGSYTVRYRQLDTGEDIRSESITLSNAKKEATLYLQRAQEH